MCREQEPTLHLSGADPVTGMGRFADGPYPREIIVKPWFVRQYEQIMHEL